MATKKGTDTKEKIFNAALKVFAKKGFSAATTAEIAEEAGVAQGTIFRYYKTKKDILRGVMIEYVDKFDEFADFDSIQKIIEDNAEKPLDEILKLIVLNRYKAFKKNFHISKVIHYEMQFHDDIMDMHLKKCKEKEGLVMKHILQHIDIDEDKYKKLGQKSLSIIFTSMMFGMFFQRLNGVRGNDEIPIEKEIDIIIDVFFNGILKR
ncbi:TetR/AcrR family transcriptional regulator [Tepidibacter hydrothermalis]|uniref:TetR/AcrR family transcriptional regulator n=1 Tax=Tepidibacter hydrothermalis TaxID=3036126 RepID=A0ABY8ECB9_9FIRM|nr:TetR/AcrR family transcriptional regulator [Tepidibacter hydrothermalis]WFD10556.1 TetR/AcrR family transcriptional regulator [Tepidibacter hydrothermalis]